MTPLGTAFSRVDALKRQLYDMLTNPRDAAAMLGGRIVESGQQAQALQEQTFGDPNRPFRVTDPQAMARLTDMLMQGPMGFAPVGTVSGSSIKNLLDQSTQKTVEAPKFEMPSFARLQPETAEDIDKIYDFLEDKAKKAGYKIETGSSNVSGSRYLTIYDDLPNDDVRSIELRVSNHADRHPVSYADERLSIDPSSLDLEEALYMLQDKGYNLFKK